MLAILGLLVVVAGIFFWIARLRGWRFEWWERFFSPGRRRESRSEPGSSGAARSGRGAAERPARARSTSTGRPAPAATTASTGGPKAGSTPSADASERQGLIDLDFLPLLDPKDAVRGSSLDREFDMGDLGAIETESGTQVRPAPRRATASPTTAGEGRAPGRTPSREPTDDEDSTAASAASEREPPADEARAPGGAQRAGRELLVVLTVVTQDESDLLGPVIQRALGAFDLEPDNHGMFHHYGNRRGQMRAPVFSVSSILEPGAFDLEAMDRVATPGLCLFMRRPGPLPATVAFDLMLDVGSRMSRSLDALLCDHQRCRLTVQATQALRERVVHFALRHEREGAGGG